MCEDLSRRTSLPGSGTHAMASGRPRLPIATCSSENLRGGYKDFLVRSLLLYFHLPGDHGHSAVQNEA
jgi:hypothetical protein